MRIWSIPEGSEVVYLVGHHRGGGKAPSWDVIGIFQDSEAAARHCESAQDFMMPLPLNIRVPREDVVPKGSHFPRAP